MRRDNESKIMKIYEFVDVPKIKKNIKNKLFFFVFLVHFFLFETTPLVNP